MTTRTFKQMGVAYGTQDLEITAKVDNVFLVTRVGVPDINPS